MVYTKWGAEDDFYYSSKYAERFWGTMNFFWEGMKCNLKN